MIDHRYGVYVPVCDGCSEELRECDTFYEAVQAAKDEGWSYDRQFETNLCPTCQEVTR